MVLETGVIIKKWIKQEFSWAAISPRGSILKMAPQYG
jgi:hypothetical protein